MSPKQARNKGICQIRVRSTRSHERQDQVDQAVFTASSQAAEQRTPELLHHKQCQRPEGKCKVFA